MIALQQALIEFEELDTLQSLAELDYDTVKADLAAIGALVSGKQAASSAGVGPAAATPTPVTAAKFEEAGTDSRRVFLVASELLRMASVISSGSSSSSSSSNTNNTAGRRIESELLSAELLREDVLKVLHAIVTFAPDVISVKTVVACLLQAAASAPLPKSTDLLVALAANAPERLSEFLEMLASPASSSSSGGAAAGPAREDAVLRLCRLAPHHARTVRAQLVRRGILPRLALRLTLEICDDVVPFLSGLLPSRKQWPWMAAIIRRDWSIAAPNRGGGSKSSGAMKSGGSMYAAVAAALAEAATASMGTGKGPDATTAAVARIHCALHCTGGQQQPQAGPGSPLHAVAAALTGRHPATPGGARLVELALCLHCVSPALTAGVGGASVEQQSAVTEWLGTLEERLSEYE